MRLLGPGSTARGQVTLKRGKYYFSVVGRGMADDQDALYVFLHKTRERLFFEARTKWEEATSDHAAVEVPGGTYAVGLVSAEPNVLVDKILIGRLR